MSLTFRQAAAKLFQSVKDIVFEKEGMTKYREVLSFLLRDGLLTPNEIEQLNFIKSKYSLTFDEVNKVNKVVLSNYWKTIISDSIITEQEKNSLEDLLNSFYLSPEDINWSQKDFNKFYTLGMLSQGVLVEIPKSQHNLEIIFQKNEILHYALNAQLCRIKKTVTRINYGGFGGSIRIAKGLRYRFGSISFTPEVNEYINTEDSGFIYITNQKIGFLGRRKQFTIQYKKVLFIDLTPMGLFIYKEGKETPYIVTMEDYEVIVSMISYIVNQN